MPVRSPRLAALAPAVVLAVLAGCSLVIDTGGLAGDPDPSAAADGAAGADAGRDGAPDAPVAGNYCAAQSPKHQFCADFDENPIGFGWSSVDDNPSISLAPDPIASSPPTSVRSRVLVSKSCTRAMLNNTFADPYVEAHFAFDLRVGGESSSFDGIYVASLEVGKCNHLIQVVSSKLAVYTQIDFPAGEDRQSTTVSVKPDAWMRVSLDIDRADGSIAFSVDGQPAIAKTVVDARCVGRAEVKMRVGLYCQNAPAELRFDNVTFDGR